MSSRLLYRISVPRKMRIIAGIFLNITNRAVKSASLERMGFATSTFFIFLDAGLGFGPYFIGIALNVIGYAELYLYSSIGAALCIVVYYLLHGRQASRKTLSSVQA